MIKVFLKLLLCIIVNTIIFMIANIALPFSQGLNEVNSSINMMAIDLIMPNALLPTNIRMAHLIEMTISMIIFGIIVGNIMWGKQKTHRI